MDKKSIYVVLDDVVVLKSDEKLIPTMEIIGEAFNKLPAGQISRDDKYKFVDELKAKGFQVLAYIKQLGQSIDVQNTAHIFIRVGISSRSLAVYGYNFIVFAKLADMYLSIYIYGSNFHIENHKPKSFNELTGKVKAILKKITIPAVSPKSKEVKTESTPPAQKKTLSKTTESKLNIEINSLSSLPVSTKSSNIQEMPTEQLVDEEVVEETFSKSPDIDYLVEEVVNSYSNKPNLPAEIKEFDEDIYINEHMLKQLLNITGQSGNTDTL